MKLAKVIGRVVLSKKDNALPNGFFAILSPQGRAGIGAGGSAAGSAFCIVAFDPHGAAAGDAVAYVLMRKVNCKFHKIGVNDRFGQSGKAADVLREYGLTADQIAETVKANI